MPEDERTTEDGIPVTSVPRTIFDLAAAEPAEVVRNMLREAEHLELWDRLSLWDLLERYPGKRGTRKVRLALERLREEPPGRRRSPLEERFAPFLRKHRLPLPRFNDGITVAGKRYEVDCHWPGTAQIVELDGITWNQLDDEPEAVGADLRALLLPGATNQLGEIVTGWRAWNPRQLRPLQHRRDRFVEL